MSKQFPMLNQVDDEIVLKRGGKAVILEKIIQRIPDAAIPRVLGTYPENLFVIPRTGERFIMRASSRLDLFGGCGLHDTYTDVHYLNCDSTAQKIMNPESLGSSRIQLFAESISQKAPKPTILVQEQDRPNYWGTLLQHPHNDNVFLIAYTEGPSRECRRANSLLDCTVEYLTRGTHAVLCDANGNIHTSRNDVSQDRFKEAVTMYRAFEDTNIVNQDWVSILEFGIHNDRIRGYQFTPIRTKARGLRSPKSDNFIFGYGEFKDTPVVKIPPFNFVQHNLMFIDQPSSLNSLNSYPDFKSFIEQCGKNYRSKDVMKGMPADIFFWNYMRSVEERFPTGYIATLDEFDSRQQFDITMRNVKAVMITSQFPLYSLTHNLSRIIAKSPVLVMDDNDRQSLETGDRVNFYCDGLNYKIH